MHRMSLGATTPYPEQLDAVKVAISVITGGVVMPTGSGKSITMALLINELQLKTLVIVPTLELKQQLSSTFKSIFGTLKNITVENIDSSALQAVGNYDLLLIDECHRSAAATYQKLNKKCWTGIYRRYFFSATYFRNQDEEQLLFEAIAGRPVYRLTFAQAVKRGLIVPVEAYYFDLPKQATDAHTWAEVYSSLVVNNSYRNEKIADLLLSLTAAGASTLCLVKEIKHGEILAALTGLPFANGQDDSSRDYIRQFSDGLIKGLIGTEGILSEGVDTRACEWVVIAALGKAKSAFLQKVGRGVRNYPGKESAKIILFRDTSHRWCLKHFNEQKKILKEELGVIVAKLET